MTDVQYGALLTNIWVATTLLLLDAPGVSWHLVLMSLTLALIWLVATYLMRKPGRRSGSTAARHSADA